MKNIITKQNKALLAELVRTDFKLRYQGSALGYAWSLLRPLVMFLILYIVFVKFLRLGSTIPNYPIYLLLGIVLWSFFAEMTSQSLTAIVGRGDLIRKIRIPRWIIIVSTSLSALINLTLNLIVVFIFALVSGMNLMETSVWLPLILLEIYLFALGLSLILATLYVKYRDVNYLWEIALQIGFYITPILYPLSLVTNITAQRLILLNPMAQAIQDARYAFVTPSTLTVGSVYGNHIFRLLPLAVVFTFLICGVLYFKKQAANFAEDL